MKIIRSFLKRIPIVSPVGSYILKLKRTCRGKYLALINPKGAYLECNGLDIYCDFRNENYWWYDGNAPNLAFDEIIINRLLEESEGDLFLDIGAHFGYFSAILCNKLFLRKNESTIIAIEPDKNNYTCLVNTLKKYNQDNLDVLALPYAVSDVDGVLNMYASDQPCLHSYAEPGAIVKSEVEAITLNTIIDKYAVSKKLAFIKVDIDGAEPLFFGGAWEALDSHKPIIFIEFAPKCLEYFGANVKDYYYMLCERFFVYWISYKSMEVKQLTLTDYDEIILEVGDMVTDLVLSYKPIKFELRNL